MNRRTLTVGVAVVVVMCAAWFVLLWSPKGAELSKAKQERSAARSETSAAELKLAGLRSAAESRANLQATETRFVSAVPLQSDLAPLILQINAAAADSGISFVSVTPTPPAVSLAGGPSKIALSVQLQGDYAPVLAFLDRLNHLDRLVVVDGITLSPQGTSTGLSSLAVSLTARAFTEASPAKAVGAAAPAPATAKAG